MIKIAIITPATLPVPAIAGGAVETLIDHIINENEKQNKLEITIYSIHDKYAKILSRNYKNSKFVYFRINPIVEKLFEIFRRVVWKFLKFNINNYLLFLNKTIKHAKKCNYDLILIENRVEFILPVSKVIHSKIYLHLHNNYLNMNTSGNRDILSVCDKVITVSEYVRRQVVSIDGYSANKVVVLKNCIDLSNYNKFDLHYSRKYIREKYRFHDDDVIIMFSGRLVPEKGVKELIQAFNKLKMNNVRLFIVGSKFFGKNTKDNYAKLLDHLTQGLRGKIVFTGFVDYKDIPKYYSSSDIVVVPSIWDEPAGLVVLEGMAIGRSLIVTDSGGLLEYTNKECAIIVKRNDLIVDSLSIAMEEIIQNPELRNNMGKAGEKHSKQFSKEKYYRKFVKIINPSAVEK